MSIADLAEYGAFRGAVGCLRQLPWSWTHWLCGRAAWLAGPVLGVRYRLVEQQLALIYPEWDRSELRRRAQAVYAHLGRSVAETFCTDPRRLAAAVRVAPGWEPLDRALAAGRGAILVSAHLGNFELGGRVLAGRYPLLDVVKPMRNRRFDVYLQRSRARHGIRTVPMENAGRTVLTHLRQGGVVTLLVDQDAGGRGVPVPFLGHPASTWPGAARLALRTGSPVLPVAILREGDRQHVLHIGEPLDLATGPGQKPDLVGLTARISAAVEAHILTRPEQWFWVHRRWKGAAEAAVKHG